MMTYNTSHGHSLSWSCQVSIRLGGDAFLVSPEKCMFAIDMFTQVRGQLEILSSMFFHFKKCVVKKKI